VDGIGIAELGDVLCALGGYENSCRCPGADIFPNCQGDGIIELGDMLAVLEGYAGGNPCGCIR